MMSKATTRRQAILAPGVRATARQEWSSQHSAFLLDCLVWNMGTLKPCKATLRQAECIYSPLVPHARQIRSGMAANPL